MKNKFKFLGIIALFAVIAFSFTACEEPKDEAITITVTEIPGSTYNGWKAVIGLYDSKTEATVAIALPLNVTSTTSSLEFTMLTPKAQTFNKAGTYIAVFWFEKAGEDDVDFYKFAQSIKSGANTIAFSTFTAK